MKVLRLESFASTSFLSTRGSVKTPKIGVGDRFIFSIFAVYGFCITTNILFSDYLSSTVLYKFCPNLNFYFHF